MMRTTTSLRTADAAGVARFGRRDPLDEDFVIRPATAEDMPAAGRIVYEAFHAIASRHGFPADFASSEVGIGLVSAIRARSDVYSIVAERRGRVVGSNFLWEGDPIAGVGPISVDVSVQDDGTGRALMEAVLERARERRVTGVRLVQAAYHNRSLALYTKLGFVPREPLSVMQGPVPEVARPHRIARVATMNDIGACNSVALRVLGQPRTAELSHAIANGDARVVEHDGRITGYTTGIGFFGHTVGESNEDVQALIGASTQIEGPGFLVPTRNASLLRWCLSHGLRIVQPMTLMSIGAYRDPVGGYLPSILY